jgi:hypothetical protein
MPCLVAATGVPRSSLIRVGGPGRSGWLLSLSPRCPGPWRSTRLARHVCPKMVRVPVGARCGHPRPSPTLGGGRCFHAAGARSAARVWELGLPHTAPGLPALPLGPASSAPDRVCTWAAPRRCTRCGRVRGPVLLLGCRPAARVTGWVQPAAGGLSSGHERSGRWCRMWRHGLEGIRVGLSCRKPLVDSSSWRAGKAPPERGPGAGPPASESN